MAQLHRYNASIRWEGSTGIGYELYDRTHIAQAQPAEATLKLSSDPAFRGKPQLLNPEQLLVIAASSCQLLSFLALCARARIDLRRYEDRVEAEMPEDNRPIRITTIVLHPRIEIASGPSEERIRQLVEQAHQQCFIANSLRSDVRVEPEIHLT